MWVDDTQCSVQQKKEQPRWAIDHHTFVPSMYCTHMHIHTVQSHETQAPLWAVETGHVLYTHINSHSTISWNPRTPLGCRDWPTAVQCVWQDQRYGRRTGWGLVARGASVPSSVVPLLPGYRAQGHLTTETDNHMGIKMLYTVIIIHVHTKGCIQGRGLGEAPRPPYNCCHIPPPLGSFKMHTFTRTCTWHCTCYAVIYTCTCMSMSMYMYVHMYMYM